MLWGSGYRDTNMNVWEKFIIETGISILEMIMYQSDFIDDSKKVHIKNALTALLEVKNDFVV